MGIFDQGDDRRPSGGGSGRFLLAIGIALVALFMYMNQVQENPVTHEKQHVAISPDQEIRLGLESAPQMAKEMGGELPESDPRVQEVNKIGQMIIHDSIAQKSPWKFDFHVLSDEKVINAFALPGGQIFITLGLLNDLQTEAELAGVLSHEIGHVIERHSAQQMAKNQLGQMLVIAVATGASDQNQGGGSAAMVASVVNQMIQLRYSREDESEADLWGIKLMVEAGFDPRAMIQVMQVLKKAGGGGGHTPEFFQTHPNPDLRIEQIEEYLKNHPPAKDLSEGKNLKEAYREFGGVPSQKEDNSGSFWDLFGN